MDMTSPYTEGNGIPHIWEFSPCIYQCLRIISSWLMVETEQYQVIHSRLCFQYVYPWNTNFCDSI